MREVWGGSLGVEVRGRGAVCWGGWRGMCSMKKKRDSRRFL